MTTNQSEQIPSEIWIENRPFDQKIIVTVCRRASKHEDDLVEKVNE